MDEREGVDGVDGVDEVDEVDETDEAGDLVEDDILRCLNDVLMEVLYVSLDC